jgi:glycosyltransferase involved in cell wall biosynthesis
MRAGLSILIPVFNCDVAALIGSLLAQAGDWPGELEICLLDDKSTATYRHRHRALASQPAVRYEELPANVGRAAIRNKLASQAKHDWLLLLDNDSLLPDDQFLARYALAVRAHPTAGLLVGGTTYLPTPPADPALRLRWHYGRAREMRSAAARQRDPGGQLAINNALIKKWLLLSYPLDERLSGYGHEDTLLGLELAQAGCEIVHLDNPVLHNGLEPGSIFLEKSRRAVHNLAQVLRTDGLGADTRLMRTATRLRRVRLAGVARATLAALEPALRRHLLSSPQPRLRALDALKLLWLLQEVR